MFLQILIMRTAVFYFILESLVMTTIFSQRVLPIHIGNIRDLSWLQQKHLWWSFFWVTLLGFKIYWKGFLWRILLNRSFYTFSCVMIVKCNPSNATLFSTGITIKIFIYVSNSNSFISVARPKPDCFNKMKFI